jgi:phosphoglycolate phosphatase-like HAD superfamily hydrolase
VRIERLGDVVSPDQPSARGHARVAVDATAPGRTTDPQKTLVAEGAGLGYFGRHTVAVATALPGFVPEVVGFRDGVVVREWMPESDRVLLDNAARVRGAVAYVARRRAAMSAQRDGAEALAGQQPAWEVAARLLAAPYGIVGLALRAGGFDAAVRSLLAPTTPSVVDAQTGSRSWFERDGALVKVSFSGRSFSNLDLACYDAAYDAAGLALGTTSFELADLARREYERQTAAPIDEERWLLYRLVHLWDLGRLDQLDTYAAEVAASRVWQEWARARLLKGPLQSPEGPWCALDVDGVLETSRLGPPVLTPSAGRGLRALDAHGYRVVLATGRSHVELEDRCARYGLSGGVAEYGGVVYDHRSGVAHTLLDDGQRAALDGCRAQLSTLTDVELPDQFCASVRAFRRGPNGTRRCLDDVTIGSVLGAARGALQAHRGVAQVDFVPEGVDKATGLAAARSLLGAPGAPIAVAVGDSAADSSMLRDAERGFVPAHARHLAGGSVRATSNSFQRGFLDAVTHVLGHRPGGCPTCRDDTELGNRPEGAALVTAVLAGLEGGRVRGLSVAPGLLARSRRALGSPRASAERPSGA